MSIDQNPEMLWPDAFTAVDLTGPQWYRTMGDLLKGGLMGWGLKNHPFTERMRKAAFDDFGISRDDCYRKALVEHLASRLSMASMKVIARKGSDISGFRFSADPGRVGMPIDPTAWARSSERRIGLCPQGIQAVFSEEYALEGLQAEIREIAAAWWNVMESIYAEVAAFRQAHRPAWIK